MPLTNFERLREIVKTSKPERLEAFDAYMHKKKAALHPDDDLWMILELIGFHTELAAEIPERVAALAQDIGVQAAKADEASAIIQHESSKIVEVLKNIGDELPHRVDTTAIATSIGAIIQSEQIKPLLEARDAVATASDKLNDSTQLARTAHKAIQRSASVIPWITSAIICAIIAAISSFIIITNERRATQQNAATQLTSLPKVYRELATQGRTLELISANNGTHQLVLSGKADGAFLVPDGRAVLQFR